MENTAHRLAEMSRKEDCDVIHNLIMAVQERYKKLQQRVAERGRMLEEVKKNSRRVSGHFSSVFFSTKGATKCFLVHKKEQIISDYYMVVFAQTCVKADSVSDWGI